MKFKKINSLAIFLIPLSLLSTSALACTTAAWNGGTSGGTLADSPPNVPRVSGLCALEVTGTGHVEDESPVAEGRYIARFYFYPPGDTTGDDTIFAAYSDDDATTEIFSVSWDGTNININGDSTGSVAAAANMWHLVEVDYDATANTIAYWVDLDATSEPMDGSVPEASGALVEAAQLGYPDGATGSPGTSDDFESHRQTAVGPLLIGDSNSDADVTLADALGALKEARPFGFELQNGTPDCNLDGDVSLADALGILKAARPFGDIPCGQ